MGLVKWSELTQRPERHIRCNPVQAQFINHANFPPVIVEGLFSKTELDAEYVQQQEDLITRAWLRLQEVTSLGIPVEQYPLAQSR